MRVMDYETAEHFYKWLDKTIHECDQHVAEQQIHAILKEHPDLIEKNYGWSEMLRMAEVSYPRESFFN
jgi:hypothetical protein